MRKIKKLCKDLTTISKWLLCEWIEIIKVIATTIIALCFLVLKIIMGILNCICYIFIMTRKMAIRRFLFSNFGLITAITCRIKRDYKLEKKYAIYIDDEYGNPKLYSIKPLIGKKPLIEKSNGKELKSIMALEDTVGYLAEPFHM